MHAILPESIMGEVAALSADGKRALAAELARMIAAEAEPAANDGGSCPRCGHTHVVRKGRARDGGQRWLCRGCGRTFGERALSVIGQSHLGAETWASYAAGMADGLTLRELAKRCGVCLKTSWFMRMRICEAMSRHLDDFRSGPGVAVEVDGKMLHESLSGDPMAGGFEMPRRRHGSGRSLHVRGVSGQLACVVCGANDRGDAFAVLAGRAHGTRETLRSALEGRLAPGTEVATDDLVTYGPVLEELGCAREVRPSRPGAGGRALGMVNAVHKRLADFLRPFNGVATRRLQRYLDWFCWAEQFRRTDADRRALVGREAREGAYRATVRELFAEPRYMMDYWEKRGWSAA